MPQSEDPAQLEEDMSRNQLSDSRQSQEKGQASTDESDSDSFVMAAPTQPVRDQDWNTKLPQTAELPQTGPLSPKALESPHATKKITVSDLADRYQITPSIAEKSESSLVLFLPEETTPIIFNDKDVITLGRLDRAANITPELDLTAYHGAELGVSRYHAVITRVNDRYHIKDMGSTNGTRVNDKKLPPYTLTPISRGDQIRVGHLTLVVG